MILFSISDPLFESWSPLPAVQLSPNSLLFPPQNTMGLFSKSSSPEKVKISWANLRNQLDQYNDRGPQAAVHNAEVTKTKNMTTRATQGSGFRAHEAGNGFYSSYMPMAKKGKSSTAIIQFLQ